MDFDKLIRKLEGLQKASRNGHKVKDLHAIMRRDEIWYLAYARIYANFGALTKGIDEITLDGFSIERVRELITRLKAGTYRPNPVRRVYIPKKDKGERPLGVPSGDDKLVQAVSQILLEQVYEPIFHDTSHGFRPQRSCHTALDQIKKIWTGTKWIIEFDIKSFFDNMDHDIMIELLEKKIDDRKFINLIKSFLKSGYLEDWKVKPTYSGTPQGGIVSPLLSNIYLHELDTFIATLKEEIEVGKTRPQNNEHARIGNTISGLRRKIRSEGSDPESIQKIRELRAIQKTLPSMRENTDQYIRLRYCRYADDFICGIAGSFRLACEVKERITEFLQKELKLEISPEKTGIRRLSRGAEFLSYKITSYKGERSRKMKIRGSYVTKRTLAGRISLSIPERKLIEFCHQKGYGNWHSQDVTHRNSLTVLSDLEILESFNSELRGLSNYYALADDFSAKMGKLSWFWYRSLLKTFARKHKCKGKHIVRRLRNHDGYYLKYEVSGVMKRRYVFRYRDRNRELFSDEIPLTATLFAHGTELIQRLEAKVCESCGDDTSPMEVHHIRRLRDLKQKKHLNKWEKIMIARRRKTLVLCRSCHNLLHSGKLPDLRSVANLKT